MWTPTIAVEVFFFFFREKEEEKQNNSKTQKKIQQNSGAFSLVKLHQSEHQAHRQHMILL